MAGWANIDMRPPNIIWDLTKPLPVRTGSIKFAYSEHFIEHLSKAAAHSLLKSVRRSLAPNGVIRISTPDLAEAVRDYAEGRLASMPEHDWQPKTLCEMMNDTFREWGHTYIYDEQELRSLLTDAGFSEIERVAWRTSQHPELTNLETRSAAGDLILEARPGNLDS